jgi:hypothetical protein
MRTLSMAAVLAVLVATSVRSMELKPETERAWQIYVARTESRIEGELERGDPFRVAETLEPAVRSRCQAQMDAGDVCVEKLVTTDDEGNPIDVPSGMIHHWFGSIFVPDVSPEQVLAWVQSYDRQKDFYPEVEDSRLISHAGDVFDIFLRLKRTKVITVHYNTEHEVTYRHYGDERASSRSVATRIREIRNPGAKNETELGPDDDRGFLWRLNSYWRFEEVEGGTFVECESISLSRSVPAAALWMVTRFLGSVPRESLEATLEPILRHFASEP